MTKEDIINIWNSQSKFKVSSIDDLCVEEPKEFAGIYCIGFFANDRGCYGDDILLGKKIGKTVELMQEALTSYGWKEKSKRAELSLLWVEKVLLCWSLPMDEKTENFGEGFEKPKSQKIDDGYQVMLWCKEPAGMRPEDVYHKMEFVISESGSLISKKILKTKRIGF